MNGVYVELPDGPQARARRELLNAAREYVPPSEPRLAEAGDVSGCHRELAGQLGGTGLGLVQLDRPFTTTEYVELGRLLGTPNPELSPDVQDQVEDEVMLNLVTRHYATDDVSRQPFAANPLTLHTESSGLPRDQQPRYISLMCETPGPDPAWAQTLLVAIRDVLGQLSAADHAVLRSTRYAEPAGASYLLADVGGRQVLSFRDFAGSPLRWCYDGDAGADEVDATLARLHTAMYAAPRVHGVTWRRGLLVVIDNTYHFHGRTAGVPPSGPTRRHLKRLRIRL